jgi:hypothetical protein
VFQHIHADEAFDPLNKPILQGLTSGTGS